MKKIAFGLLLMMVPGLLAVIFLDAPPWAGYMIGIHTVVWWEAVKLTVVMKAFLRAAMGFDEV